ncbi:plastocyanin/azurin family copper-binding protein [Pedococcus sp. KACC 23699]|uniref:Plastocyanin/azurin family copper-binding protein n=1 Tax=Pedococcus sp. KACC 23699 TaxID=3149228 RepID=A0AAU7JTP7_9MICO
MHRNLQPRRRLVLLVAGLVALVLPVAVGQSATASAPASAPTSASLHVHRHAKPVTWHVTVGAETPTMAVSAMSFLPREVWINKGDTVHWTAGSAEPHTVTFLAPGTSLPTFNPFDPNQTMKRGTHRYNGTKYTNSGIIATQPIFVFTHPVKSYDLTFTKKGNFTYYCLLHGVMMKGMVHVRAAGTPYPYTQRDYNRVGHHQARVLLHDGKVAWRQARRAHPVTGHQVQVGIDGNGFAVMRFIRSHSVIHVGETVTFSVAGPGAPHTVTFGKEPAGLGILKPSGDPKHFGGGDLNSGVLAPGKPFTVTFTKAGRFSYICAIHDGMGMVGNVLVKP